MVAMIQDVRTDLMPRRGAMPTAHHRWVVLWAVLTLCGAERLGAQGVTGAAVQGTVAGADSVPVAEATVLITNTSTGERWQAVTQGNGRFFLEHLSVGGPYGSTCAPSDSDRPSVTASHCRWASASPSTSG